MYCILQCRGAWGVGRTKGAEAGGGSLECDWHSMSTGYKRQLTGAATTGKCLCGWGWHTNGKHGASRSATEVREWEAQRFGLKKTSGERLGDSTWIKRHLTSRRSLSTQVWEHCHHTFLYGAEATRTCPMCCTEKVFCSTHCNPAFNCQNKLPNLRLELRSEAFLCCSVARNPNCSNFLSQMSALSHTGPSVGSMWCEIEARK